jgi:hypothetical protein
MEWETGTHQGKRFFCAYHPLARGKWCWEFQVDDDGPEGLSCSSTPNFEVAQWEAVTAVQRAIAAWAEFELSGTLASEPLVDLTLDAAVDRGRGYLRR